MTNGKVDEAEVDVILSGGRREIDRFVVVAVMQMQKTLDSRTAIDRWLESKQRLITAAIAIFAGLVAAASGISVLVDRIWG